MRYILIVLWLVLGPAYYFLAQNCAEEDTPLDLIEKTALAVSNTPVAPIETPCPDIGPYFFIRNSAELNTTAQWSNYKDSLLALLTTDKKIQIIGLVADGETNKIHDDLGSVRAEAIAALLGVREDRLQIYTSDIGKVQYSSDCKISGARIKLVTVTEKIKEIQDRTLIYFPYNSTNKLNDTEVESYLDALALKVLKTNERIRLTGHTDDKGEADYNLDLGQSRAEIIKSYLVSKDVPGENVLTFSAGETIPIADNTTEAGRAQNRRTELEIIK